MVKRLLFLLTFFLVAGCSLSTDAVVPTAPPTRAATEAPTLDPTQAATATRANPTRTPQTLLSTFAPQGILLTPMVGDNGALVTPSSGMRATITTPAEGTTITAVPITISGIVYDLTGDRITVEITDAQGGQIAPPLDVVITAPIGVRQASWSVGTNIRSYTGAAQVRVYADPANSTRTLIGGVNVTIAPNAAPAAVSTTQSGLGGAAFTNPTEGGTTSGDPITVSGMMGGLPENQFQLELHTASGTMINAQQITLTGADTGVVPWSATLGTGGYRGAAELRATVVRGGQIVPLVSVRFTLQ